MNPTPDGPANGAEGSAAFGTTQFGRTECHGIQHALTSYLPPEFLESRSAFGGSRLTYLEGWRAISLANTIFGFNGWSSRIVSTDVDFCDASPDGRYSLGLSCTIRVTLKDGTMHEDIGYGSIDNAKGKAAAFEKAKKEAVTDGLKRALRMFGNSLGNCLYDKKYLRQVARIPSKGNADVTLGQLYRPSENYFYAAHTGPVPTASPPGRPGGGPVPLPPRPCASAPGPGKLATRS
ncbi:DNA repair protein rad52 [Tieghemiomyces parasiticus]|uniref:DNA repair protein rad52 n=1 Tax=Tieghemiomyces parasiticus TaxID=78921 RepID=A0A9W8AK22_9FUNG|nr:DNA repair protein rad52 [Tieghemiomyces parasiticus]